ncbi:outer membrane protein assembly factor BamB family protein [Rhodopirellula sallentina]|uniref:Pyrrolo-quinoline quinone n=1 Tax=Rhodopirellula sallentina SM41 TaxID=1263870 RepID=M5U6E1_9BACT|nr:PQQ-binding-like beta-propeller repeat protein [Rhodopirellula sallentina]EMI57037.1 Pyrrolo-quinoline quinone [Rhodopirellula sallentina SM41]
MTNPNDGYAVSKSETDAAPSTAPSSSDQAVSANRTPFLRRAAFSAGAGILIIGVIQYFAPDFDYQFAFLGCFGVGVISLLLTLYFLQRAAHRAGRTWLVPVSTLAIAIVFISLVKVRTMSGEMIPQLGWRFSTREVPELQTSPAAPIAPDASNNVAASGNDPNNANGAAESNRPSEEIAAGTDANTDDATPSSETLVIEWGQFLGNNRNGVVSNRAFTIPKSASEVETIWNIGIGGGWSSFAVAGDIAVTLEQREDRECVTAYRVSDGELLWMVDHEATHTHPLGGAGPRSTPAIDQNRVYAQGATGMVWCLDLVTGQVIWETDLLKTAGWDQVESEVAVTWGRSGSPLIVDGLCVLPFGANADASQRSLIAFDAKSGEIRWTAGEDQISYASPQLMTLAGVRQIVSVNEQTITGHLIETGEQLWETDWFGQSSGGANCASAIDAGNDRFLIGKGYGGGSALIEVQQSSSNDGFVAEDVWRSNRVMKTKFNHAVVRDGVAYALSNGALQAVDIDSGDRLWEQSRRSRSGQGQVILAGDTLIVQEEMGDVLFVDATPDEYRELLRIDALQHKTWNVPSLAGNILLVRNSVQAMAFRLPRK